MGIIAVVRSGDNHGGGGVWVVVVGDGLAVTTTTTYSQFRSNFGLTTTPPEHIRLPVWQWGHALAALTKI